MLKHKSLSIYKQTKINISFGMKKEKERRDPNLSHCNTRCIWKQKAIEERNSNTVDNGPTN